MFQASNRCEKQKLILAVDANPNSNLKARVNTSFVRSKTVATEKNELKNLILKTVICRYRYERKYAHRYTCD
jgi:hypothetical protein